MTETARVLLTVAILSSVALTAFVWRLTRPLYESHERLVDQLHLSQWAAVLLAVSGGVGLGQAVAGAAAPGAMAEAVVGVLTIASALVVLRREPAQALIVAGLALVLHALFDWIHHSPTLAMMPVTTTVPPWWSAGSALLLAYVALLCLIGAFAGGGPTDVTRRK